MLSYTLTYSYLTCSLCASPEHASFREVPISMYIRYHDLEHMKAWEINYNLVPRTDEDDSDSDVEAISTVEALEELIPESSSVDSTRDSNHGGTFRKIVMARDGLIRKQSRGYDEQMGDFSRRNSQELTFTRKVSQRKRTNRVG